MRTDRTKVFEGREDRPHKSVSGEGAGLPKKMEGRGNRPRKNNLRRGNGPYQKDLRGGETDRTKMLGGPRKNYLRGGETDRAKRLGRGRGKDRTKSKVAGGEEKPKSKIEIKEKK